MQKLRDADPKLDKTINALIQHGLEFVDVRSCSHNTDMFRHWNIITFNVPKGVEIPEEVREYFYHKEGDPLCKMRMKVEWKADTVEKLAGAYTTVWNKVLYKLGLDGSHIG